MKHPESSHRWRSVLLLISMALFSLMVILPTTLQSQTCQEKIGIAEERYNAGLFDAVLALDLPACIAKGETQFPKELQIRAYKVLILIALYRDQDAEATDMMQKLFELEPEYAVNDSIDPNEFRVLHNRFDTDPVLKLEGRVGGNFNQPLYLPNSGVTVGSQAEESYSILLNPGFQVGGIASKTIGLRLDVSVGLLYRFLSYELRESLPVFDANPDDGTESSLSLSFTEQQNWVDVPLSIHWNLVKEKQQPIVPYLFAGITGHYLIAGRFKEVQRSLTDLNNGNEARVLQVTSKKIGITQDPSLRNRLNLSLHGGAGLQFKAGYNYITFEMAGLWMTRNLVKNANRYSNEELLYTFGYIDDDFIQLIPQLSVGFKHLLYNPKLKQ